MTVFIFGIHNVKELLLRHCSRGHPMHVMSLSLGRPQLAEGGERAASGRVPSLQGSLLTHCPVPVPEPTLLTVQAGTEVMSEIGKVMGGTEYACDTCRNQNRSRGRHLLVPIGETWSKLYTNPNITKWRFYLCISTYVHLVSLTGHWYMTLWQVMYHLVNLFKSREYYHHPKVLTY